MPRTSAAAAEDTRQPITQLKLAIVQSGIPQRRIAARLRMSPFRLSRIVCGRQDPTADEQDRLAEYLNAPRRALFRIVALLTVWSAL